MVRPIDDDFTAQRVHPNKLLAISEYIIAPIYCPAVSCQVPDRTTVDTSCQIYLLCDFWQMRLIRDTSLVEI